MTDGPATVLAPARRVGGAASVTGATVRAWSGRARDSATVVIPALLAGALALHGLASRSIWIDESASISIAAQHGHALWAGIAHDGGNMLVYYLMLHVLVGWFGDGIEVVRLPSVVATAATAGLLALVARRLWGPRAAVASGLLSAVSLPLVFWGQNARSYALMVTFVTASFLAFVVLVDRDRRAPAPRWVWLSYAVVTSLACYMSFVAVLVVPAQLLSLAVWRPSAKTVRAVVGALVLAGMSCIPLAVLATRRGSGQLFWVVRPTLAGLGQLVHYLASSGVLPNFPLTATSDALLVLTGVLVVAVTAGGIARPADPWSATGPTCDEGSPATPGRDGQATVTWSRRGRWTWVLACGWLVVPVVLGVAESFVGQSIFVPRNFLMCVPAVALLLGAGLTRPHVPRPLGWSIVAVLLVLRGLQVAPTYGVSPENWRAATSYVVARTEPGDCIAFYPSDGRMAVDYYLEGDPSSEARAPRPVLPSVPFAEVRAYVEQYVTLSGRRLRAVERSCPRLWLVTSHSGEPDGTTASKEDYTRFVTLVGSLQRAYSSTRVVSFGWASPVRVELLAH
ncbi:MAG: glycosyltransferase family 39 protein [Acidimicrobiales bacterium]